MLRPYLSFCLKMIVTTVYQIKLGLKGNLVLSAELIKQLATVKSFKADVSKVSLSSLRNVGFETIYGGQLRYQLS